MAADIREINELIQRESSFVDLLTMEIGKVIVGQKHMVERLLIGLLGNGHILLEGVPGLAKTMAIKTLAQAVKAKFQRIQFTPDLLPADLIGTMIYNQKDGSFQTKKGPIFSNFILADEINRAPAKVQSALLEAMQERQVTIGEKTYFLEEPFLVMATQNPIEQEGTYPLPEAQVDRFMLKVKITYPERAEELEIMRRNTGADAPKLNPVVSIEDIMNARQVLKNVYVDEKIERYILDIVFATRTPKDFGLDNLTSLISYGASPRASIFLAIAAKAHAFIKRRGYLIPEVQWFYSIEHSYYWNFWMKKRCPFIVITENKRSYAGIFFSNHGLSKPTPHISEIEAFGYADDIIKIALFDDNLANSDYNLAKDIRETEEIKNSLKSAGLFNGGLEYKIDDLKIRSADTIEISASIKNIDRNNLYIFNLRNALYDALKTRPVFIFANKDNTTGYRFTFERIITSDLLNSSDEYFKLEKDKSITFTCTAVCGKKVISSDYYFYSYFYGERSRFEKDKRVKSDGRVWMGKTRSNYMDINYNTSTGVTIKNKDYKFE